MTVSVPVIRKVAAPVSDVWVKKIVVAALRGARSQPPAEANVIFVGDAEMKRLNASYRGKTATTDVLSFGNDGAWPEAGTRHFLGDVVISVAQAKRQAQQAGKPLRREFALLLVHGVLHLLGYDHATLEEEKAMFALQDRILKTARYA